MPRELGRPSLRQVRCIDVLPFGELSLLGLPVRAEDCLTGEGKVWQQGCRIRLGHPQLMSAGGWVWGQLIHPTTRVACHEHLEQLPQLRLDCFGVLGTQPWQQLQQSVGLVVLR